MHHSQFSITLLFNANKVYDRQVIEGIGHYLRSSKVDWDLYLEDDFLCRLDSLNEWAGDGIIADFDNPDIEQALQNINKPVVGVGGSYRDNSLYPKVPYVCTDNDKLVEAAYRHLRSKGIERYAFYSLPECRYQRWALEREQAMLAHTHQDGFECQVYRGYSTKPDTWQYNMNRLSDWIQSLPKPIGIVAATDARARHLLQACQNLGLVVPDQVSVVGIDDDDIARHLSKISLTSITQGCFEMGYEAARLLHRQLIDSPINNKLIKVPPVGVAARQSSDYKALQDAYVIQAMNFIRQNATRGVKVEQVTDHVGISRSNLELRFKQERGHSIHCELHHQKLAKACKLLKDSQLACADIAQSCGYPSLQYMYTVFKRHFDLTPTKYREKVTGTVDQAQISYLDTSEYEAQAN